MIRKISLSVLAMSMFVSFVSAEVNFDNGKNLNIKEGLSNIEVPAPSAPQNKGVIWDWLFGKPSPKTPPEWTIMVFVNGKNSLEPFVFTDMNEMEAVGSSSKLNIVVEAGSLGVETTPGNWKGTRRFLIAKDSNAAKLTSPVVQDMGKVDMGDYKSVIDFGNWAKKTYPANHYMLIIWNHGGGWLKSVNAIVNKGISYDDETGNHINTPQMGLILKGIGGVDVYGSDACLMQMAEVVYEIKDYATYIVGSEETEPGDGYTYNTFLGPLAAKPAMTPAELAKTAVEAYANHYQASGEGSTQSFVKSAAIPGLLDAVNAFSYAITQAGDKSVVKKAMNSAQSYAITENKDLYHFAQLVTAGTKSADVKAKGKALMNYITGTLVMDNRTTGNYSNSHGIAIYMPQMSPENGYADLAWAKYSNWDEFINWYQQP